MSQPIDLDAIIEAGKRAKESADPTGSLTAKYALLAIDSADHLAARVKQNAEDWVADDTAIRNACRGLIPDKDIDGDSYGVPTMVDVVVAVAARVKELEAKLERVSGIIETELDRNPRTMALWL